MKNPEIVIETFNADDLYDISAFELLLSQSSSQTSEYITKTLVDLKAIGVLIPKPESIALYLIEHPDMIDVLPIVYEMAKSKIKGKFQLSLELYSDPEINYQYLVFNARRKIYSPTFLKVIKEIREEYSSKLANKSGRILITTDFLKLV